LILNTRNRILVEASPADKVWWIGLEEDSADANNPFHWNGLNLLGFALMEVRGKLLSQAKINSTTLLKETPDGI
jgi:ribA/ribD-fused uncharacterized protein